MLELLYKCAMRRIYRLDRPMTRKEQRITNDMLNLYRCCVALAVPDAVILRACKLHGIKYRNGVFNVNYDPSEPLKFRRLVVEVLKCCCQ